MIGAVAAYRQSPQDAWQIGARGMRNALLEEAVAAGDSAPRSDPAAAGFAGHAGKIDGVPRPNEPSKTLRGNEQARTVFLAQQAAQDAGRPSVRPASADASGSESDAVTRFLEFMSLTPEERLYQQILKDMGLTEEQLAALPPEERMRVEREIQQKMEERLALQASNRTDDKAG